MTNKELLYIEDALGHAQFMTQQCQQAVVFLMMMTNMISLLMPLLKDWKIFTR